MKIQRLVLHNWQSYKGPENVFDFRGPESTNNSGMIIGRNAQGKSALFEAIQFVLYGQLAVVDRDSKNIPKRCKPLAAESVEAAPLMNQDAWDAGEREFSVSLDAVISNTGYTFVRKMTATTENPNDDDFKPQFFILSQPTKTKIKNPEKFVEDILPQSITKFFMIDGELLIEYRNMFAVERPRLQNDLENILRMRVIDKTSHLLKTLSNKFRTQAKKIHQSSVKSKKHAEELEELLREIEETESKRDRCEEKINQFSKQKKKPGLGCQNTGTALQRPKQLKEFVPV